MTTPAMLQRLKSRLRIDDLDTEDDVFLQECIDHATARVELTADLDIEPAQYTATFRLDAESPWLKIDRSGVSAVSQVQALREDGTLATTTDYNLEYRNKLPYLSLGGGNWLPATDDQPTAVIAYIRSLPDTGKVRKLVDQLILDEAANCYAHPNAYNPGSPIKRNPRVAVITKLVMGFRSVAKHSA